MAEGDTIHRAAHRIEDALGGRRLDLARAPSRRSPLHGRAEPLLGRRLLGTRARGKHLLLDFDGDLVVHSHLGINGSWRVETREGPAASRAWLVIGAGRTRASQLGGRALRLISESRARADPALRGLGPDPLGSGFDRAVAARRLRDGGAGRELGEALLDQRLLAGVGNVIRNEACFEAALDPWRAVETLDEAEAARLVAAVERTMRTSLELGERPRAIYGAGRAGCPACAGPVSVRGQGDANRTTYWCPRCQR